LWKKTKVQLFIYSMTVWSYIFIEGITGIIYRFLERYSLESKIIKVSFVICSTDGFAKIGGFPGIDSWHLSLTSRVFYRISIRSRFHFGSHPLTMIPRRRMISQSVKCDEIVVGSEWYYWRGRCMNLFLKSSPIQLSYIVHRPSLRILFFGKEKHSEERFFVCCFTRRYTSYEKFDKHNHWF